MLRHGLCLLILLIGLSFNLAQAYAVEAESAYDRVIRTNTLRCGYGTWKPGVYQDAKTGKMTGLFVDLMETIGKLNGLKIEWASEIDWGQISTALKSGKIDAFCAGMVGDAARGKFLAYSPPLSYWTFGVLVRAGDQRFIGKDTIQPAALNKPEFSTAYTEGDVLETIAHTEFPAVKGVPLPPLGTPADNLLYVVTKKTDFVVFPKFMFNEYNRANPGKLRYLILDPPLRTYGNVIATDIGDDRLARLIAAAVNELVNTGTYQSIMTKYNRNDPGAFQLVQPGYQEK